MADRDFSNDGLTELNRKEHEGKSLESKRVQLVGYIPGTDTPVRLTAVDNGDGTFSLKTSGGGGGGGTVDQGDAGTEAEAWFVTVVSGALTKKTVTATSSGNNTIHTPASGKKIRLYFFGYSAGAGVSGVLAGLRFGASGTVFDQQYLVAPGQPYARNIQAGKRYIDGAVDEPLIVNLSAAQTVYANVELEEI